MLHSKPPSGVKVLMGSSAVGLLSAAAAGGRTPDLIKCCVLFLTADGKREGNLPGRSDGNTCCWNTGISQLQLHLFTRRHTQSNSVMTSSKGPKKIASL